MCRCTVLRIDVARTTLRDSISSASSPASNPSSRDHSPMYGGPGSWACMPASRSIASSGADVVALEQQLAGEGRAVESARGEGLRRHGPEGIRACGLGTFDSRSGVV